MAQVISRQTLTAEAWVSSHGISGGQSGTVTGFSLSSLLYPVNIIPLGLHTHLSSD
jgi:hypothetical protein